MFGIGGNELLIIGVFALIIFGPDKIPEIARTAGKAIKMFKRAQEDVENVIKKELYIPDVFGESSDNAGSITKSPNAISNAADIWESAADGDEEAEEE